jgi:steroid 5-alpha reductase family enzyme
MLGFGIVFAGPGDVLPLAVAAVAVLMLLVWATSLVVEDVSIVDPAWGPAFVLVALVAALAGSGDPARRWLLVGMLGVWGLRLGLYLVRRKLAEPGEDRRYARMRKQHPNFALWSLGWIFGVQGVLVLIVSLPVQVAARRPDTLSLWILPGLLVYAVGIVFEATGDEQLRRFKSDPANKGQVMDRGLWRYTRHPNYFGDACVWWGVWLVVLQAGGSWWTAIGPAVMTVLLVRVSGAALLEQDIGKRRPGYAEYIRRTSGFLPRPPRD